MGHIFRAALVGVLVLAVTGCGSDEDKAGQSKNAPLAFVPANTPYVIANLKTADEQTAKQLYQVADEKLPRYVGRLRSTSKQLQAEGKDKLAKFTSTLADELDGKMKDIFEKDGIDPRAPAAIYGVGLSPVIRLPIADSDKFDQFVKRMVDGSGLDFSTDKLSGRSYQHTSLAKGKLQLVISRHDKTGVLALLPADASQDLMGTVLGSEKPEKSMQASGRRLKKLADDRGYLETVAIGYLDTTKLPALLTESGADSLIAAMLDIPGNKAKALPESCEKDLTRIASRVPLLTMGYTKLEPKVVSVQYNIDLASDITGALSGIEAPMPGLGAKTQAPLDIIWGLPIDSIRKFVKSQTRAVKHDPFSCEPLTRLNREFAKVGDTVNYAAMPPLAGMSGIRLSLQSLDYEPGSQQPPKDKGSTILDDMD